MRILALPESLLLGERYPTDLAFHEVTYVYNGRAALTELLTHYDYDLALLPLMMPEIDAITVCKQLTSVDNIVLLASDYSNPDSIRVAAGKDVRVILLPSQRGLLSDLLQKIPPNCDGE
ncbi:MAG: hypothetical protein JSS66_09160 [Armatimonadetes bacterium]|nr:hypothetical protein [Armatimonadota bacterium]